MDGFDLFRKLGVGAKFDFKRFHSDAQRLKLTRPSQPSRTLSSSTKGTASPPNTSQSKHTLESHDGTSKSKKMKVDSLVSKREGFVGSTKKGHSDSDLSEKDSDSDDSETSNSNEDENEGANDELQLLGNIRSRGDNSQLEKMKEKQKKKRTKTAEKIKALKEEHVNHIRNVHRIHAHGTDSPDPIESFDELHRKFGLHPRILQNIKDIGYQNPTPIQMQAVPAMLHKREVMACAPTGSGKTAAFILPILHHLKEPRNEGIRALVLAPTRELAKQTYREFQRLSEGIGFRIKYIDKLGNPKKVPLKSGRKVDIMVSTPNRLISLLKQDPPQVNLSSVLWLVVDESDKLFEEGKAGFRDQLGEIYKACDGRYIRRAMFSATFAFDVEEWCKLNLDNVLQVYIGARNSATELIEQQLLFVGSESGKLLAVRNIIRQGVQPPVLVFLQSKERAKELFRELIYDGLNVDVIHADRTQQQRDNVVRSFRAGKIWILICTELMGRGIDFKGVNLVINYDFPNSAITYIHRIGRTGRAGRPGKAITFFTEEDAINLRSIANVMKTAGCPVPDYMLEFQKPNSKKKRKLAKFVPVRDRISTVPQYNLDKARKRRRMISKQKKKKFKSADSGQSNSTAQKTSQSHSGALDQENKQSNSRTRVSASKKILTEKRLKVINNRTRVKSKPLKRLKEPRQLKNKVKKTKL